MNDFENFEEVPDCDYSALTASLERSITAAQIWAQNDAKSATINNTKMCNAQR